MSCIETIKYLHEFMDKELDTPHYHLIKKHIDNCGECYKKHKFETDVRALVKASCVHTTAPAYLRDRICEGLNAIDISSAAHSGTKVIYKLRGVRTLFSPRSYAIAASVLISIAGGIFYSVNSYKNDPATIVNNAVENHVVALHDNLVFNEKTSVIGKVDKYLGNMINTNFNNSSPFFSAEQVSVTGGAPVKSYGTSSPCIIFDKGGNKLSLQIIRKSGFPITNLEKTRFGHKEFYLGNCRGFNSVLWKEDGVTYCLTSDMSKNEMLKFAATLTPQ